MGLSEQKQEIKSLPIVLFVDHVYDGTMEEGPFCWWKEYLDRSAHTCSLLGGRAGGVEGQSETILSHTLTNTETYQLIGQCEQVRT